MDISGRFVVLGFSGGPDALALAHRLQLCGAEVMPVYISYRKTGGGKTKKDLRAARSSAAALKFPAPLVIWEPLGMRAKSERNRFFIPLLALIARSRGARTVAIGTIQEAGNADLDPAILSACGAEHGVDVLTWDSFWIREKSEEFPGMVGMQCALSLTTSCQLWWNVECGNCHSCLARHTAFLKAFGRDPTIYRMGSRCAK